MSWERKEINAFESMDIGEEDILREYRDWLLGGERFEWRYYRSKLDSTLILERR